MNTNMERVWTNWSTTKLDVLHKCPLAFKFSYVEHQDVAQSSDKVFDIVIYNFANRHMTFNDGYRSQNTMINSFIRYWLEVVKGVHGPNYLKSPPIKIRYSKTSSDDYIGIGVNLLRGFYVANQPYFEKILSRPTFLNKRWSFPWRGVYVVTKIDRIENSSCGDVIYVYKTGSYKPNDIEIVNGHQFTFYSLAYRAKMGGPPAKLAYWYLKPNSTEIVPVVARTPQHYKELSKELREARDFVCSALVPEGSTNILDPAKLVDFSLPAKHCATFFRHKGKHCDYCDFREICMEYDNVETFETEDIVGELSRITKQSNSTQMVLKLYL